MTTDYQKIANALEAVADYIDDTEGKRMREKQAATQERLAALEARYQESTGEALPADLRDKFASLGEAALDHVLKLAKTAGGSPESLGGPDDDHSTKTAEATDDPHEKFARWIMS